MIIQVVTPSREKPYNQLKHIRLKGDVSLQEVKIFISWGKLESRQYFTKWLDDSQFK